MDKLHFCVNMKPILWKRPAGTSQRFDSQIADKNAFALMAYLAVKDLLARAEKTDWGCVYGQSVPLRVRFVFELLKPPTGALEFPTDKHDIDNYCKFALDALQSGCIAGKLWKDDGQVVELCAVKRFVLKDPCTIITVERITAL